MRQKSPPPAARASPHRMRAAVDLAIFEARGRPAKPALRLMELLFAGADPGKLRDHFFFIRA